ncbi:AAA family ATPase [Phenylobacterium sp.]|uniref:AAA family ATPase n=1 Tax=Phenylobacterium sp. TaxID=1871053 RepID=UPI003BADB3A9
MALPVSDFSASGYRSLRQIAYPVSNLEVFVGANGVGKSNLYRALELLRAAASNTLGAELAREGMAAAFWAGTRQKNQPSRMSFSVDLSVPGRPGVGYRYEVEVGFPFPTSPAFATEPQIKTEQLSYLSGGRPVRLLDRKGPSVMARDEEGRPQEVDIDLLASETVLARLEDPGKYPGLDVVRRTLLEWRFYHDLRTDAASPLRRPCTAVASPTLASDGSNLAAVFATLAHIRQDTADLDAVIDQAFPGARLVVPEPDRMASFGMSFPDFPHRVFEAAELSDGTLKFLALAGALMAYRLPTFVALNEPESSLHPALMKPLARLVGQASERSQVWLVTHSEALASEIAKATVGTVRTVTKTEGATAIVGLTRLGTFREDD